MYEGYVMLKEKLYDREFYYSMIQDAPDAIIALDSSGHFIVFNAMAERISLFSREDVLGKHFAKINILHPVSIPKALQEFALAMAGKERQPFEVTVLRKDGTVVVLDALPKLAKSSGVGLYGVVILRDVSERKKREEEVAGMNKLMVDRELKMIELKKRIKELGEDKVLY